jgi:membrane associated rhomboid family serine protease
MQIIVPLLILITLVFSYKGFSNQVFYDRYKFQVDKILLNREYRRLVTTGFLHINWLHLIFNMMVLFSLGGMVVSRLGPLEFLLIYFGALVGGGLLSLFIHRYHGDYSSVGASGSIGGVLFASIALYPGMGIGLFLLPISLPGWLFGLLYILFSIYGIKSRNSNIGHEAHLGGALVGMLIALLLEPSAMVNNYITILIILVPAIVFIWLILTRPEFLLIDNFFFKKHHDNLTLDQKYNLEKNKRQLEIDKILDKINRKGMKSLSREERDRLEQYSKRP